MREISELLVVVLNFWLVEHGSVEYTAIKGRSVLACNVFWFSFFLHIWLGINEPFSESRKHM